MKNSTLILLAIYTVAVAAAASYGGHYHGVATSYQERDEAMRNMGVTAARFVEAKK